MTIEREPGTFEHAVKVIMDHLGTDGVARFAEQNGWSVSLVEKWSLPTVDRCPNVHQALALDTAYIMAGGEGAPMHEAHEALLTREVGESVACRRALAATIAEASAEMGDATAAAIMLTQPGASPHQIHRAMREAEQALGAVGRLRRTIRRFLSTGGRVPGGAHQ
ncbi:hypothetical protein [Sphingomonas sp. Mn802worker]|uniref:hypothetical protein n=1 Tax=Sphingomonas sp. Mn802worker TaxID=629773 RepID=UPI0003812BC1|nr:hypothetical protein [Sphingomonas sp. Mn802worker]